jgi:mRNA interferase MazF
VKVRQRDIWLVDLREPVGSEAGYTRPAVIVQADGINASRLSTYVVVPVTSLIARTIVPWNLTMTTKSTGLKKDSVAQTNLILTVNEAQLIEHVGMISQAQLGQLFKCLDIALGRL